MRPLACAVLLTLCTAGAISAQSPADAAVLARLDAAIGIATLPELPAAEDGVARQLQDGLEELARYVDDQDRTALERALFRFAQASGRRSTWPWPEYAMARAFFALHAVEAPLLPSSGVRLGEPYQEAAWRHLLEALRRDADMPEARALLALQAYPSGDRELREPTRAALEIEVARGDAHPDALVAWARHQRALREYQPALATLERAAARGADPMVVALEGARLLAGLSRWDEATRRYWQGLTRVTPRGRDLYRQDIGWILLADSLADFDSVATGDLAEWLQRFWAVRDAAAVGDRNDRLREHLRRWVVAHERFRIPRPWTRTLYTRVDIGIEGRPACIGNATPFLERIPIKPPTLPGDPRDREPLLDHRALLYFKHGEPFAQIVPPSTAMLPTEEDPAIVPDRFGTEEMESQMARSAVWVYWIEGSWRPFYLQGSNALGGHAPTTLVSFAKGGSATFEAIARVIPAYRAIANRLMIAESRFVPPPFPVSCEAEFQAMVRRMRADANVAIDTDSDLPPMVRPWNAALRFFAIGHAAHADGRALVTFAIPFRDLTADTLRDGRLLWPVTFHLVAFRHRDGARVELDSTRNFTTGTVPDGGNLSGTFELPLADGAWQVALLARQRADTTGGAYALRRNLTIDGGAGLALSDLVTGRAGQPAWLAPDGPFPVNTLGTWAPGGTVELWYEVRGVPAGEAYHSTLQILPTEDRLRREISVRVADRSPGGAIRVRRTLGLENLDPGRYRLVVTVEHGGRTAVREQEILVAEN